MNFSEGRSIATFSTRIFSSYSGCLKPRLKNDEKLKKITQQLPPKNE